MTHLNGAALPDPPTSPECDLRGMPYMPLDVVRLLNSDLWVLSTGEEFKAAMALLLSSWLQSPAGSLPIDDRLLAHLSGSGLRWKHVKSRALHGWYTCSDGRMYHPVVAEKVTDAWQCRLDRRARTEAARAAKLKAKTVSDTQPPPPVTESVTEPVTANVTRLVTGSKGTEQNGKKERKKDSDPGGSDASASRNPRDWLWVEGVGKIRTLTGQSDRNARSLIGRLVKSARDDCGKVAGALVEAIDLQPIDPTAWLIKAVGAPTKADAWAWVNDLDAEANDEHRPTITH